MFPVFRIKVRSKCTQLGLIARGILSLSVQSSDCLALKVKTLIFFKTSGNVYPLSQRNIPEDNSLIKF